MPFRKRQASVDTNILYYFFAAGRLDILWTLFPEGIWIDPTVFYEIRREFENDLKAWLYEQGLGYQVERQFEDAHNVEIAEIKARHRGLKHPDIATIVVAGKHGIACLSADDAVRKTCDERGIHFARHIGCLEEAVRREIIVPAEAIRILDAFQTEGLYLPLPLVTECRESWRNL